MRQRGTSGKGDVEEQEVPTCSNADNTSSESEADEIESTEHGARNSARDARRKWKKMVDEQMEVDPNDPEYEDKEPNETASTKQGGKKRRVGKANTDTRKKGKAKTKKAEEQYHW